MMKDWMTEQYAKENLNKSKTYQATVSFAITFEAETPEDLEVMKDHIANEFDFNDAVAKGNFEMKTEEV